MSFAGSRRPVTPSTGRSSVRPHAGAGAYATSMRVGRRTREAIVERLASNTGPRPHGAGEEAVREGTAWRQGIANCGACGRRLATHGTGRTSSPGHRRDGKTLAGEHRSSCPYIGAVQTDRAAPEAVPEAVRPAAIEAAPRASGQLETDNGQTLESGGWRPYEAEWAKRRYRAVGPGHRLVARGGYANGSRARSRLRKHRLNRGASSMIGPGASTTKSAMRFWRSPGPPMRMRGPRQHGAGQEGVVRQRLARLAGPVPGESPRASRRLRPGTATRQDPANRVRPLSLVRRLPGFDERPLAPCPLPLGQCRTVNPSPSRESTTLRAPAWPSRLRTRSRR